MGENYIQSSIQVKSITGAQALDSCLDPIIKTSVVGGRCLVEAHCSDLRNTECMADKDLRCSTGERASGSPCLDSK